MQTYKCHKVVKAFKLHKITGLRLIGDDPADFVDVSPIFIVNHNVTIKAGCYIVIYENSYTSVSPVDVFEKGYKAVKIKSSDEKGGESADKTKTKKVRKNKKTN